MEENSIYIDLSNEAFEERYELSLERVREFPGGLEGAAAEYFTVLKELSELCDTVRTSGKKDREINEALFYDVKNENYEKSFLDPDLAYEKLGSTGPLLSAWYLEYRGIIPFTFENRIKDVTVILETTIQLFNAFEEHMAALQAAAPSGEAEKKAETKLQDELKEIIYSYLYDYADEFMADYLKHNADPGSAFAADIVMNADLNNTGDDSYLYSFGEWITEEELGTAGIMAELPEETIERMAAAYVDGYINGFAMTGKDIKKKSVVCCYLPLGFERFMRAAIKQFEVAGLKVVLSRNPVHLINKKTSANIRPGFYGAFNKECEFDHKEDLAYFWGSKLKARKLKAAAAAYEENNELLKQFSGNACVEIFGAEGKAPKAKKHSPAFNKHQLDINKEYAFKAHETASRYMPDEEISFTIIAWPTPSIAGDRADYESETAFAAKYRELFDKFIEINTLPVDKWQAIQQCLIDALDKADYAEVKGVSGNDTFVKVMLHPLQDPAKQTNFENCLADVNIPAGEVFTSPLLKGTDGVIHAGYVYISGYLFKDLKIRFENGRVADYSCSNFEDREAGRELIRKIIFKNREELPLGEFAIGTNTAAYAAARKYGIEAKMPVLIAEKTGPHFAVGDTCYSFEEDIATFNPDGKQITARENECSALRHTTPDKAYFSVHTDITLPYNELLYIKAVGAEGEITIIENGRFVLPGTEALNEAL
ncbi:MAG: aminopeptidase [Eubacteriales bacterium]|nr:aminopeptidase [Eubacteriales bacterium]